jgi:hypothetical protein
MFPKKQMGLFIMKGLILNNTTSIKCMVAYTTLTSFHTIAYITSTMMERFITCTTRPYQLTTKYYSTLDTLMITCLKGAFVCGVHRTQSLNTRHYMVLQVRSADSIKISYGVIHAPMTINFCMSFF